jgi:hypothetical protein
MRLRKPEGVAQSSMANSMLVAGNVSKRQREGNPTEGRFADEPYIELKVSFAVG